MSKSLNEIMAQFNVNASIDNYGNGHINDTYISKPDDYILQRINTNIFKNPAGLMDNIENVTAFLRKKIAAYGGDPERETLTVVHTMDDKNYYQDGDACFRMYKFVSNTITIENADDPMDMYRAGHGFGRFQALLDDYPALTLHETIADFHNTPKRLEALEKAISEDKVGRVKDVVDEIKFVLDRKEMASTVVKAIDDGEIPVRVTHNDTKINNILFDADTREAICVIDLDTVMPGSALYDFGDALRIGASTAAEDETNLDEVHFDIEKFKAFAKGYLEETSKLLTKKEMELLAFSAKLMTFECGVRFLTDHIDGDTYFKIHRKNHNLDRARNQFKLVAEIEEMEEELNQLIYGICAEIRLKDKKKK